LSLGCSPAEDGLGAVISVRFSQRSVLRRVRPEP